MATTLISLLENTIKSISPHIRRISQLVETSSKVHVFMNHIRPCVFVIFTLASFTVLPVSEVCASPAAVIYRLGAMGYEFAGTPVGGIVVDQSIDVGKQAWTNARREAVKRELEQIAGDSQQYAPLVRSLIPNINPDTTPQEFNVMVKELVATISRLDAADAAMSAKIYNLQFRQQVTENRITEIVRLQQQYKREFEAAVDDLDRRVISVGIALDLERIEREEADQKLSKRISAIEKVVLPETRATTAAKLGSDGAKIMLADGNVFDAIQMLRLSIAYDKHVHKHGDPAARYWLAMAYKKVRLDIPADEMLSEAVVFERHQGLPEWYLRVIEKFNTPERIWLERRSKPSFC